MAFIGMYTKLFFIGFLFSFGQVQDVLSQGTKIYTQSNSASWQGNSPFKEFWKLKSESDQDEEALLLKLLKLLTKENAAYKRLENSDISTAVANLDFKVTETPSKRSSEVTLRIVLNTVENLNSGNDAGDGSTSNQDSTKSSDSGNNTQNAENNSQLSKFDQTVVDRHNMYRKKHGVPPLTYSKQISQVSQDWADQLAKNDEFKHRPNNKYGENLYVYWTSNPNHQLSPNAAVDSWYAESKHYTYSQNVNIVLVGHFTQLVWKNSKNLGIGMAKSKTNKFYVVCNYSPPGNVLGQFTKNVLKPTKS